VTVAKALLEWTPQTQRALSRLDASGRDAEPVLRQFGEYKRRRIIGLLASRPKGEAAAPGEPPASHTASLRQSITYNASGTHLEVGTADVRGRLLQEGGKILPKRARALAVPIHKDAIGKRPKDFADLQYVPRKGRAPLLVRESGKRNVRTTVMFILLRSVTIHPHPYLFWTDEDETKLLTLVDRAFKKA